MASFLSRTPSRWIALTAVLVLTAHLGTACGTTTSDSDSDSDSDVGAAAAVGAGGQLVDPACAYVGPSDPCEYPKSFNGGPEPGTCGVRPRAWYPLGNTEYVEWPNLEPLADQVGELVARAGRPTDEVFAELPPACSESFKAEPHHLEW